MQVLVDMSYPVEILLGALVFLQAVPRRRHFAPRFALGVVLALAGGWALSPLRDQGEIANMMALQLIIACTVLCMWVAFAGSFVSVLSACVSGVAAQHIGHHVSRLVAELPWIPHWTNALELVCACVVYLILYLALGRRLRDSRYYDYADPKLMLVSAAIILVCTGITRLLRMAGQLNPFGVAATALYAITCCVLALLIEFSLYNGLRRESENRLMRRIHEEERKQYEASRENAELLNVKYHDLKRILSTLEGRLPQGDIDSLRNAISSYDSTYHTGNETLDIILNEKAASARERGISLTCMGSGDNLSFMEAMDVYSLFGNLVDNAMTAVELLDEPQRRVISIVMERKGSFLYVDTMNYFQGEVPELKDGLPLTSKETERGYHGYGLRSVQAVARKYGGDLSIQFGDGIFAAHVYLVDDGDC